MFERTKALYADLAATLGLPALTPDANGGIQLTIGEDINVILFGDDDTAILAVAPIMPLPDDLSHGATLWLLRKNFYDSGIAPFTVACDAAGTLILWGHVPMSGLTGPRLAGLLDALAAEAKGIRAEIAAE